MDELIAFLKARLDHLELAGRTMTAQLDREWTLADVESKRRIIDLYARTAQIRDEADSRWRGAPNKKDLTERDRAQREASILEGPVRLLALPYVGHPDYREEWRP